MTKAYRLGPAVLHLAAVREQTTPRKQAVLASLADATGETAHASVLTGTTMYLLAACESRMHSTRAIIDLTVFPLHATASGLSALAFGPDHLLDVALSDMHAYTTQTPLSGDELRARIDETRRAGIGRSRKSFQIDIDSMSAPVFDQSGAFAGAVSVAAVATRFDDALERRIIPNLIQASRNLTQSWGGHVPPELEAAWDRTLPRDPAQETAT